jgi:hypothetical protein
VVFTTTLVTALLLSLPHGWHEWRADPHVRSTCDPVLLLVAGSERPRLDRAGWRAPRRVLVLVFVEVDHVNHPVGPLPRPRRFHVPWSHLQPLAGCCGTPASRGWVTWFRQGRQVLGYLVFAGPGVSAGRRAATERMLDSLRVRA